jgi:hypothetical protein
MTIDPTHAYRVLGLAPGATLDEIKMAYRDLAQVWHPDRFPDHDRLRLKALHNQRLINEAYAVLQKYRPQPAAPGAVSVAAPPPPSALRAPRHRHLKHSFFTGVASMRHSLKVLWPSATYARRRRRRMIPLSWMVLGFLALLILALAAAAMLRAQSPRF